jgi:hypothetical protein
MTSNARTFYEVLNRRYMQDGPMVTVNFLLWGFYLMFIQFHDSILFAINVVAGLVTIGHVTWKWSREAREWMKKYKKQWWKW